MTRNLVEAIIQCGGNMQQARAHLYASLLHCLKMSVSSDTSDVKLGGAIAQVRLIWGLIRVIIG